MFDIDDNDKQLLNMNDISVIFSIFSKDSKLTVNNWLHFENI